MSKRECDEDSEEDIPEYISHKRIKKEPDDLEILHDLQTGLTKSDDDLNDHINEQLCHTQKQYYLAYMEKLLNQNPMGQEIVNIVKNMKKGNEFEYMFTAAKSVVQSQMKLKQIKALHAVSDMLSNLVFRYVHENVVVPALSKNSTSEHLKQAYFAYQKNSECTDDNTLEIQCLLYTISNMQEKKEPTKIVNPLYSNFTQKLNGLSQYICFLMRVKCLPPEENEEQEKKEYEFHQNPGSSKEK